MSLIVFVAVMNLKQSITTSQMIQKLLLQSCYWRFFVCLCLPYYSPANIKTALEGTMLAVTCACQNDHTHIVFHTFNQNSFVWNQIIFGCFYTLHCIWIKDMMDGFVVPIFSGTTFYKIKKSILFSLMHTVYQNCKDYIFKILLVL